jgi:formylmethanofuran dehydrogenase subunit A
MKHKPLVIIGGKVIDPAHARPVVREVFVADGQIVEHRPHGECGTIDAQGALVMAGAIDMHAHIASRGVELAREVQPPSAAVVPSPHETGIGYARMGYTTVIDAAVPFSEAEFAHRTLDDTPNLDAGFLLEIGGDPQLIELIADQGPDAAVPYLGQKLHESQAFGLKIVNPGASDRLDGRLGESSVTGRQLLRACAAAAQELKLSHPLHVHGFQLGQPGNVETTIEMLEALDDFPIHLAHAQFHAYANGRGGRLSSGATRLSHYLSTHPNITTDIGCVTFGPAMMISRDEALGDRLCANTGKSLVCNNGWCIMPMYYSSRNAAHAVQHALGLDLMLRSADRTRTALSVDHPNGSPFTRIPDLLTELADRGMDDEDLVTVTRVAPARALGLKHKGHLAPGADADVVISDRVDAVPTFVIKAGELIVKDGRSVGQVQGKRLSCNGKPA